MRVLTCSRRALKRQLRTRACRYRRLFLSTGTRRGRGGPRGHLVGPTGAAAQARPRAVPAVAEHEEAPAPSCRALLHPTYCEPAPVLVVGF